MIVREPLPCFMPEEAQTAVGFRRDAAMGSRPRNFLASGRGGGQGVWESI